MSLRLIQGNENRVRPLEAVLRPIEFFNELQGHHSSAERVLSGAVNPTAANEPSSTTNCPTAIESWRPRSRKFSLHISAAEASRLSRKRCDLASVSYQIFCACHKLSSKGSSRSVRAITRGVVEASRFKRARVKLDHRPLHVLIGQIAQRVALQCHPIGLSQGNEGADLLQVDGILFQGPAHAGIDGKTCGHGESRRLGHARTR